MEQPTTAIPLQQLENFAADHLAQTPIYPIRRHFQVFSYAEAPCKKQVGPSRRDFYKISLITKGSGIFVYDGKRYEVTGPVLSFINPGSVKSWQTTSKEHEGFYCIFREDFFHQQKQLLHELRKYPLFKVGIKPCHAIETSQIAAFSTIFKKMQQEVSASRPLKNDMLMLHLQELLLHGLRLHQQKEQQPGELDAAHRHTRRFLELLEKQFSIEKLQDQIDLYTPAQFAESLALHHNHLNALVKEVTGQTVRKHIQQRILLEARLLLIHTHWAIADIAFCLRFSEPASFSHFIRRHTNRSPSSIRADAAKIPQPFS